ncbi:MAG: hypothetical protein HON04_04960 [Planctomicrobium sp.]|jgi:hypothetical protein|nr:hypothetical protein [Planctomicrobium sp.]
MHLFSWIRKLIHTEHPIEYGRVLVSQTEIVYRTSHSDTAVSITELVQISIRTTPEGPFVEDVYFVLKGASTTLTFPQQANGVGEFVELLTELPGFNSEAFLATMSCTSDHEFLCWKRTLP